MSILVWYCIRKEIGTLHFSSKHFGPHLSLEHICLPVQMKKQYSMGMGWIMLRMSLKHGLSMAVILIIILNDSKYTELILVTTATTGGGVLFLSWGTFSIENAKYWLILINLGYFVANLSTLWCIFYMS